MTFRLGDNIFLLPQMVYARSFSVNSPPQVTNTWINFVQSKTRLIRLIATGVAVLVIQLCPTLCDPRAC